MLLKVGLVEFAQNVIDSEIRCLQSISAKLNGEFANSPKKIKQQEKFATAEVKMQATEINFMVVTDDQNNVVGALQIYNQQT